ncbi:MAG: ribosome maturation factor RimM [Candidatus Limivicinus sp.]
MEKKQYIEAGQIVNTHGVRGEVKIQVWLDSPAFLKRCGRIYIDGRELKFLSCREQKGFLLCRLEGIGDVNSAMSLKGKKIFIDRADAKLPKGDFFLQDLIGARVLDEGGSEVGILTEIMETPASPVYVVRGGEEHLIPAVPEFILSTDIENGIVRVHLIEGM